MRKLTKALAAVLLLAIVLSCFAVFSAFAEGEAVEETTATSERVVIWNMDDYDSIEISHANSKGNAGDSLTKITDDKGTYWHWTHDTDGTENAFWTIGFETAASNYDMSAVVADILFTKEIEIDNGDGTTTTKLTYATKEDGSYDVKYEKNTDYIVVDFDISTDSTFISDVYFNMRNYGNVGQAVRDASKFLTLNSNRPDTDDFYMGLDSSKTSSRKNLYPAGNKWTNVTIVYDYSDEFDHAAVESGTVPAWKAYIYIDGFLVFTHSIGSSSNVYATSVPYTSSLSWMHQLGYWRVSSGKDGTNVAGSNTNFANFTVSKFPAGYEGDFTENLGRSEVNIFATEDLAYCYDNFNEEEANPIPLAVITHADNTTTDVFEDDDLSGDLKDGDKVQLNKPITSSFIVVTKGDTITWTDKKGTSLDSTDPAPLVSMPKLLEVDAGKDWAVIVDGVVAKTGMASEICYYASNNGTTGRVSVDPLYGAIDGTKNNVIMLFNDVTSYGSGTKSTQYNAEDGSSISSTTTATKNITGSVKYDLNGHKLTINPAGSNHYLTTASGGTSIVMKNGELEPLCSKNVFYSVSDRGMTITLKDITINNMSGTMYDQRGDTIVFIDCDITVKSILTSSKAQGGVSAGVVIVNSTIKHDAAGKDDYATIMMKNVGNKGGSFNISVIVKDSTIESTVSKPVFRIDTYSNTTTGTAYVKNDNYVDISVVGSEIKAASNIIYGNIQNSNVTENNDSTDLWVRFGACGSTLNSPTPIFMGGSSTTNGQSFIQHLDAVFAGNTKLNSTNGIIEYNKYTSKSNATADTKADIYLGDGVMLKLEKVLVNSYSPKTLNLEYTKETSKVVHTSNGDGIYKYVVSSDYRDCKYVLGATEYPFQWNAQTDDEDKVDIDRLVTLAEATDVYKYEWDVQGNVWTAVLDNNFKFKAKSTLILENDLTYNFYVDKAEADALLDAGVVVMINGSQLTKESATAVKDGATYYVVRVLDIAPTAAADNAISFSVSINGAYGEENVEVITGAASVLDYIEGILNKNAASETPNAESVELMKAILNYITAAHAYEGSTADAKVAELLGDYTAQYAISGESQYEAIDGVDQISAFYGATVGWGFKGTAGTELTVKYGDEEKTVVLSDNGIVYVDVPAQYFASGVTVNGKALNLKGYYDELTSDAAKAITEALWNYSYAAAEYAANK